MIPSAPSSGPRLTPGSPWMPMPISISSSARVNVGSLAAGRIVGDMPTPIVRVLALVAFATVATSSSDPPASAAAPARL